MRRTAIFVSLCSLLLMAACSSARYMEDGKYILDQNRIDMIRPAENISPEDLRSLVRQQPHKKTLGIFRASTWAWYYSHQGKPTSLKRWMQRTIAREPVILDTSLSLSSAGLIDLYMENKGHFGNRIQYSVRTRKKSARVTFHVTPGTTYRIDSVRMTNPDPTLSHFIQPDLANSLLQPGSIYDVDVLDDERDRIVAQVKEYGYYAFVKEYITYRIDSTLPGNRMQVNMNIALPEGMPEHPRHRIRKVFIYPDFDPLHIPEGGWDTLIVAEKRFSIDKPPGLYHFLYPGRLRIHPDALLQGIFIEPGRMFALGSVQQTYRRLSDLRLMRSVNIQFRQLPGDKHSPMQWMDSEIRLNRAPTHAFTIETEGTNSAGDLGIAGNLVYENRNLFRNAETFSLRTKGALEVQRLARDGEDEFLFFNTFETGAEASLRFPRFLLPIRLKQFPKLFEPVTHIDVGVNFRQRPAYRRLLTNLSFGYEWKESTNRRHLLYPADINSVNVYSDSTFNPRIYGPLYQAQYSDHLIVAIKYSFIYNDQNTSEGGNYLYFRGNASSAGNFVNFLGSFIRMSESPEGYEKLLNIRYAQFVRLDADLRYYQVLTPRQKLVYRLAGGVGIPYGNSDVLPFEQAFFSGGANSLRGWEVRSLGPGGYADANATLYDKIGDILLEANIEYRFPVYSYLKGALFADAGNIWLLRPNTSFPDGAFTLTDFPSQLALDAGLGMRLDFGFFLFRIDAAMPLRKPSEPEQQRWVSTRLMQWKDLVWNLGIGYPF